MSASPKAELCPAQPATRRISAELRRTPAARGFAGSTRPELRRRVSWTRWVLTDGNSYAPLVESGRQEIGGAELPRALACRDDDALLDFVGDGPQPRRPLRCQPVLFGRQQFKGDEAQCPHVGRRANSVSTQLLGSHVEQSADRLRHRGRIGDSFRETEVQNLDGEGDVRAVAPGEEDVRGLQITVNDAHAVGRTERVTDLPENIKHFRRTERSALPQVCPEVLALKVLHCEPGEPGLLVEPRGDHLNDVFALDPRTDRRFLGEPPPQLRVIGKVDLHELQSSLTPSAQLSREIDGPHSPGADQALDPEVVADHLTTGQPREPHGLILPVIPRERARAAPRFYACVGAPDRLRHAFQEVPSRTRSAWRPTFVDRIRRGCDYRATPP